jgi:DNA-binding PadR family transcriptional regulator
VAVAAVTPLALSALALLVERPMHPYEMYRLMVERYEHEIVKVKPGTLYHAVARMADAGLVEAVGTDREGGRPERTTYRVTERGRRVLAERLRELLARPVDEYPSFPVALGEAHNLPRDEVLALLRERIRALGAKLDETAARVARAATTVDEVHLVDRHYLAEMATAERDFLHRLVVRIENGELGWPSRP